MNRTSLELTPERIIALLAHGGIHAEIELAQDHGRRITIQPPGEDTPRRGFCVAIRPEGVFVLSFAGLFRIADQATPENIIVRLAIDTVNQTEIAFDAAAYCLEPYSFQRWLNDGRQHRIRALTTCGWNLLPDDENEALSNKYLARYWEHDRLLGQDPSIITESHPFVTWETSQACLLHEQDKASFHVVVQQSEDRFLEALISLGLADQQVIALDINHSGYSFYPGQIRRLPGVEWPVDLFPGWCFCLFVDVNFTCGVFASPQELTLCAFGQGLVEELLRKPLAFAGQIIRSSTRTPDA